MVVRVYYQAVLFDSGCVFLEVDGDAMLFVGYSFVKDAGWWVPVAGEPVEVGVGV
jgi:hypothetical protein